MEENLTRVTEFIFLGFSDLQRLQLLLFVFVLLIYLIILIGNSLTIVVTVADIKLHTPMYFFLRNLSALEICYTTVTVPKILSDFLSERHTISFLGCVAQMYFFILFGVSECCLLVVMCYDRYAAICNPMSYPLIMNGKVCVRMAAVVWTVGNVVACEQVAAIFSLPFHGSNVINHFFCDVLPVLRLASTETSLNELITTMLSVVLILIPFLLIITSYIRIMSTVLKMHSAEGRHKAFSTCSSHLISVTLFYGSTLVTYLRPSSEGSTNTDRALSLFYTVVTPTFNPIIYSLKNKEVKTALKKLVGRSIGLQFS